MAIPKNMVPKNQQLTQQLKSISKELLFVLFMLALVLVLKPTTASAATLNVATGNGATNLGDSLCQIEEAIASINAQQNEGDCVATGTYGTDDTINLPNGTITGSGSSLPSINGSVDGIFKIMGQGRDVSILEQTAFNIDGGSGIDNVELEGFSISSNNDQTLRGRYTDLSVENVKATSAGSASAIEVVNGDLSIKNSEISNPSYLSGSGLSFLILHEASNDNYNLNIENSTMSQSNTGLIMFAGSGYQLVANIKNSTFTDIHGNGNNEFAVTAGITAITSEGATINYTTTNNTFSNISNNVAGPNPATVIREMGDTGGIINHTAQNDVYAVGNGSDTVNYSQLIGSGVGPSPTFNITSLGGNISSDNSFSAMLNQSSDKHNQTTLADFLGILTDNGGPVPTISLLANSPAIDSGTNVSGMTTDARGVTRPQGASFDSGAYELEQSTPEEPGGSESGSAQNTTTVVNPGLKSPASSVSQFSNKPITITTPTGTTITDSNTVTESSLANQDGNNQYPLGLVNFTFNTSQTDNQVTLTFITDLKPNQVKPRKYNPDNKTYTDITNYTLTETTVDGKHALVLTYTITDNGDLDTNKTTGIISDPVGLAMSNSTYDQLANTGQNAILIATTGIVMVIAGVATTLLTKLKKTRYLFR